MSSIACSIGSRPVVRAGSAAEEQRLVGHRRQRRRHDRWCARRLRRGQARRLRRCRPRRREHAAHVDELPGRQADDEAGRGRRRHPALRVPRRRGDGAGEARKRDDPRRTLERFEPAHDLRLLSGESLGGKRLVRLAHRVVVDAVEPAGEGRVAGPALRAGGQVRVGDGLAARGRRAPEVRKGVVGEMTVSPGFD